MHLPARLINRAWCETVRVMQQALRLEVDRLDGATFEVASRSLADAALDAASRSLLYDRFRTALDEVMNDPGEGSSGRFNVADIWGEGGE